MSAGTLIADPRSHTNPHTANDQRLRRKGWWRKDGDTRTDEIVPVFPRGLLTGIWRSTVGLSPEDDAWPHGDLAEERPGPGRTPGLRLSGPAGTVLVSHTPLGSMRLTTPDTLIERWLPTLYPAKI